MRHLVAAFALCLSLSTLAASSTAATKPANAQQERMKACNEKAKGMKGDERNTFMSSCLKGEEAKPANAQQQRMKECNEKAKGKTGDDRKAFMSTCLKG